MKYLISLLVFSVSMTLALPSLAAGGGGKGHRDNTALFPQPQPNSDKATPPAVPQLSEPAFLGKVSGTVVLKWQEAPRANSYHVQVATDPNFKWLKIDKHGVTTTSLEASGLDAGRRYYWRVASWKNDNMAAENKSSFASSTFDLQ